MGLRILHSADWHLDSPFGSLPETQRLRLRECQRQIPGMAAELCRRENCDLVLLSGDLFDGAVSRDTLDDVKRALADCVVPVYISPGNHDPYGPDSVWAAEDWPSNVHIFTGDLTFDEPEGLDCRVYGGAFRSMDCDGLLDGFRAEGSSRYCVAVLHGDPTRADSPCCPVTAAQVRESGLDYLALGHIHKAGSFRAGSTLCAWPGCPMGRGWDETGEKGFNLVTLDDGVDIRQIPSRLPAFHDLTVDAADAEKALPSGQTDDLYRVTLTGNGPVDIPSLRKKYSFLPWLVIRDRTASEKDFWEESDTDSFRGVYYSLLRSSSADPDVIRLAGEISARLLQGREVVLP